MQFLIMPPLAARAEALSVLRASARYWSEFPHVVTDAAAEYRSWTHKQKYQERGHRFSRRAALAARRVPVCPQGCPPIPEPSLPPPCQDRFTRVQQAIERSLLIQEQLKLSLQQNRELRREMHRLRQCFPRTDSATAPCAP